MKRILLAVSMMVLVIGCKDMKLDIQDSKDRIDALETTVAAITEQIAGLNSAISGLKEVDEELRGLIDALESPNEDHSELIEALKIKDGEIDDRIDNLQTYIDEQLKNATELAEATFATLEQYSAIQEDIADIRALVESAKEAITAEYTSAVEAAIDALEKNVQDQIKALSDRVGKLEEDFVSRIQSLKYIPEYSDRKVVMWDVYEGLSLDFLVSPSNQAAQVQKAWEAAGETVTAYLRITKSPETRAVGEAVPLSVTSVTGSADGVLSVTMVPIDNTFLFGNDNSAVAYINISDGNSDVFSDMVDVCFGPHIGTKNLAKSVNCKRQTANSYIISEAGGYRFPTVKGNGSESVGSVTSAEVLWESFGSDVAPAVGDLVAAAEYSYGHIVFRTADTFKEGNAVIAAKDADGNILWSWHIWFTDQPAEQVYLNNAGTMMDRNLGATSAAPGNVGAYGLMYQWGRKDPFMGSSSSSAESAALSTITWPSVVSSDSNRCTIEYAISHPTTFITYDNINNDWYYTGTSSTDDTRWTTSDKPKSIYDPCPAGWRVPDGGNDGIWDKAGMKGSVYDGTLKGVSFDMGSSAAWYPATGYRNSFAGELSGSGWYASYWSASPYETYAHDMRFSMYDNVEISLYCARACGCPVRCVKVTD